MRPAKKLQPPCEKKCKLKCTERITEDQRLMIFQNYRNLGDCGERKKFIVTAIEIVQPKYRRVELTIIVEPKSDQ